MAYLLLNFLLIAFAVMLWMSMTAFKKSIVTKKIRKKFSALGYTIISISPIQKPHQILEPPSSIDDWMFIAAQPGPIYFLYKEVIYSDDESKKRICLVQIKYLLFIVLTLNFHFVDN